MIFLLHQYRVLKAIALFGYHYIADLHPTFSEIKIPFMSGDTVVKHIHALQNLGCISVVSLGDKPYVSVTQRGIEYFFELKRTIVNGLLSFLSALFFALLGFFLGLN